MANSPRAGQVLAARQAAGLTQAQAAELVYVTPRSWTHYEGGTRQMPAAAFELFKIKTKQQPKPR